MLLFAGDFIAVNKYDYGIRLPVIRKKIINIHEPQRGDIFVFHYPPAPNTYYIKRVIGLPGDHISYINKVLRINGKLIPQTFVKNTIDRDGDNTWHTTEYQEDLLGVKHDIYIVPDRSSADFKDILVPPGMYFAMGDNRDDSADSRFWGLVSRDMVVGEAFITLFSWDREIPMRDIFRLLGSIRPDRVLKLLY